MILLLNTRATRAKNRRFPLSVLALAAALPEGVTWEIVDGNLEGSDPAAEAAAIVAARAGTDDPVRLVGMTRHARPAAPLRGARRARAQGAFPRISRSCGAATSRASTRRRSCARPTWTTSSAGRASGRSPSSSASSQGASTPRPSRGSAGRTAGEPRLNPERVWEGPDAFPHVPWDRVDVPTYLRPSALGARSGVYQASIGCPYTCNFCGVIGAFGSREKFASPARTAADLALLVARHGMDAVHFYDNNFFLREEHAVELCERIAPLGLKWWAEARIDAMLRFSDATWRTIRRAGLTMAYFGAESGSNERLKKMSKNLTIEQTLALAAKTKEHGILPEFSFVFGDPDDPEDDVETNLAFIERLAAINPDLKLITYFYTPTPQRRGTYGNVDPLSATPATLEEWTTPEWLGVDDARGSARPVAAAAPQGTRRGLRPPAEGRARAGGLAGLRPPEGSPVSAVLAARDAYRLWSDTYDEENPLTTLDEAAVRLLTPRPRGPRPPRRRLRHGPPPRLPRGARRALPAGVDLVFEMLARGPARAGPSRRDRRRGPPGAAVSRRRASTSCGAGSRPATSRRSRRSTPSSRASSGPAGAPSSRTSTPRRSAAATRASSATPPAPSHAVEHVVHERARPRGRRARRRALVRFRPGRSASAPRCAPSTSGPGSSTATRATRACRSSSP